MEREHGLYRTGVSSRAYVLRTSGELNEYFCHLCPSSSRVELSCKHSAIYSHEEFEDSTVVLSKRNFEFLLS